MSEKPPGLELVQSPPSPMTHTMSEERRRRPRLSLTAEQFRLSIAGKIFSVADLSVEGMAIRILENEDFRYFPVAMVLEGVLNLRGEKLPVSARVRHIRGELVGCEFVDLNESALKILRLFLDPTVMGKELRPIPSSETGTTWYHGPSGTDLLFWRSPDGQYRRLTAFILGSFVQWDVLEGLVTGRTRTSQEQGEEWGVVRFETMLLDRDSTPDFQKLSVAKVLVMSSNLPQDLKKWCLRQLETSS